MSEKEENQRLTERYHVEHTQPLTMSTSVATRHSQSELCSVLDLRTGLYSQSTAYVYSILETEILTGKLG